MKNSIILLVSFLLIAASSIGQTNNSNDFDFGFEKFEKIAPTGKQTYKWFQWGSGYKFTSDTLVKNLGKKSVLIEPAGEKAPNSFGCVAMAIPASYEAAEIEVRASMKLNNVVDGTIGLMVRIDGAAGTLGFDNMMDKNIQGTSDWTVYSVKIPYSQNAKTIFIGALLSGKGQLWVDDFQVLLDGKDIREAKIANIKELKVNLDKEFDKGSKISNIALTKSTIEDLDVLGKVWGYLKYYHPAVAAGEYNWDYELFRILPKVTNAKNQKERNSILNNWVLSLRNFESSTSEKKFDETVKMTPDLTWMDQKKLGPELFSSLNKVKQAKRSELNYYVGLMQNVKNPDFKNERVYSAMNYPDPGFRLLCLYRYWNIIHYYFPYKNLIKEDWNKVLGEYIPTFINAGTELEYELAALSLISRIHDTHASVWGTDNTLNDFRGQKYSSLEVTFVENKAVVTDYFDKALGEKTGLKIGDVIESIDNKPVDEIVKERLPITSASNYPAQLRDIARNLLRTNNASLNIKYSNGKETVTTQVAAYGSTELNIRDKYLKRDTCFKMIDPHVAYLYPGTIKNAYLPKIMSEVSKAKGLIIDLRCYPSEFIVFSLSEYLQPEKKSFAKFSNGSLTTPGLFTMREGDKIGKTNPDYYKGKVVIIVNETTISQAEYTSMALRTAPSAKVIGSTTAGADGNVSRIYLPGDINTAISGVGVYYPDGRETQRIGIVPDVEVKPTIKGIREKKDELLDAAIKMINSN